MGLHVLFTTEKLIVNYSQGYDILVFMNIDFVVVFLLFSFYIQAFIASTCLSIGLSYRALVT